LIIIHWRLKQKGYITYKCTHPQKTYTKAIEAKVKKGMDSLSVFSKSSLELAVTQTVTKLSEYSSDGLDLDLILFRLCEISINKGLTAAETESFLKIATDAWAKKKLNSK
jgi:hypothetical protein